MAHLSRGSSKKIVIETADQIAAIRRCVVAGKQIKKGQTITLDMLLFKRPNKGIAPFQTIDIVGKTAKSDIDVDNPIDWSDLN